MDFNQPQPESDGQMIKRVIWFIVALILLAAIIFGIRALRSQRVIDDTSAPVAELPQNNGQIAGSTTPEYTGPQTHTVTLTDEGYSPKAITIFAGDTIKFTNSSNMRMWTASDPHPTHTDYIGFDEKKADPSGASWEFKFTKPGTWNYHNHLNSIFRGSVTVVATEQKG
jgi:plastocyanin